MTAHNAPASPPPTSTNREQQAHLAAMREAAIKPVDCPHCDKTCNGGAGLSSHIRSAHPDAA